MPVNVTISTDQVPASYCVTDIATDWPFLVQLLSGQIAGTANLYNFGSSTPVAADEDKPWIRLNADGTPDRTYVFAQGAWLSKHSLPTGSVMLYKGTEASLTTFDGGAAGTITATSGPMWAKISDMDGRVPLGPGTLTVSGTVVGVTDTGGVDKISKTLTKANLPAHSHKTGIDGSGITDDREAGRTRVGAGTELGFNATNETSNVMESRDTGDGEAFDLDNMPPYYGIFFIERTARVYYKV